MAKKQFYDKDAIRAFLNSLSNAGLTLSYTGASRPIKERPVPIVKQKKRVVPGVSFTGFYSVPVPVFRTSYRRKK